MQTHIPPDPAPDRQHAARTLIQGVYAITPDENSTPRLLTAVQAALAAGIRLLQYRQKHASPCLKRAQLQALKSLCTEYQTLLIVNDDWQLAAELDITAVHLGEDDGDIAQARQVLGPDALIGVSCYDSIERARTLAPLADYLAFGALFSSGTKPLARSAPLSLFGQKSVRALARPLVGIGGINASNIGQVRASGADAAAVIGALFGQPDVGVAARQLLAAYQG